jgi:hypothetical protein
MSVCGAPAQCIEVLDRYLARKDAFRVLVVFKIAQNCGPESIRYKCRMIRLTDEEWERIRNHFPEEHIADGRPGRKPIPTRRILEAVLWLLNTGAQWHKLSQLQNGTSALSGLVPR